MKVTCHALRQWGVALLVSAAVAGCSEPVTSSLRRPSVPTAASLARLGISASDRHVFMFNGDIPADFAERITERGGTVLISQPEIGMVQVSGLMDVDAAFLARGRGDVARDYVGQWVPSPDQASVAMQSFATPTEPSSAQRPQLALGLSAQWNMFQIHAPEAWNLYTGKPTVRVAILDSGLDPDHLDQRGLIDVAASKAFVASTSVGSPPWADDFFHGTYVGGQVTSNNIVLAGVAPDVTLIAVKVLGATGGGDIFTTIAGIVYATNVGAQVINMSLGVTLPKQAPGAQFFHMAMTRAVNYAKSHGVLVVSASGNDGRDLQTANAYISLPCEAGVQLCISATGPGNTFASYSNYGTNAINVAAPGGGETPPQFVFGLCSSKTNFPVLLACKTPPGVTGTRYISANGTSGAAPHVSGLAALLDSQFGPLGGELNASQLLTLIQQNADDLGKPGSDPFFGKGQINVFRTLTTAAPPPTP